MTTSWAEFLQRWSSPGVDALAYIVTCLGSELFYTVALPVIYWAWSKRTGYRLGILFLLSMWLNSALKYALAIPRPPATPKARIIHAETGGGYGFPSGHAQGSSTFWGYLASEEGKRWLWLVASVIVGLVSLSRIYLNVHWPADVAGGIAIGAVLVFSGWLAGRLTERLRPSGPVCVAAAVTGPLILYWVHHSAEVYMMVGLLIGLPIGRMLEERMIGWEEKAPWAIQIRKVLLGMAGFLVIRTGLKAILPDMGLMHVFRYTVAGIWVSFGAPWAFKTLGWDRNAHGMSSVCSHEESTAVQGDGGRPASPKERE